MDEPQLCLWLRKGTHTETSWHTHTDIPPHINPHVEKVILQHQSPETQAMKFKWMPNLTAHFHIDKTTHRREAQLPSGEAANRNHIFLHWGTKPQMPTHQTLQSWSTITSTMAKTKAYKHHGLDHSKHRDQQFSDTIPRLAQLETSETYHTK